MSVSAHHPSTFGASTPPTLRCDGCGNPLAFTHLCPACAIRLALTVKDDEEELPAELFPELEIEGPVGRGGFGTVLKAHHRRLQRPVALKSLDNLLARSAASREFFAREMAAAGRLDHPGIVRAYDAGEREGHWFLITEFLDGVDTGAVVRRHGHLPVAEACEIVRQAALALHYAHGVGVVHRDVKPGNLMLTRSTHGPSMVKVLDFGLAVSTGAEGDAGGTPGYTAPETLMPGTAADARADVYGLGATLRRFLTGQAPQGSAGGELSLATQQKRLSAAPVPLVKSHPALPRKLAVLCDRCMASDPVQRPQSAAEVAALMVPWARGADLTRLFLESPLPEKPLPAFWRLYPRGTAVAAIVFLGAVLASVMMRPESRVSAVGVVKNVSRPVFSAALMENRQLTADTAPRLLTDDWEPEFEISMSDPVGAGRYLPDGRVAFLLDGPQGVVIRVDDAKKSTDLVIIGKDEEVRALTADPVSGRLLWAQRNNNEGLHLGRAERDGKLLSGLRFDFAAEFPSGAFETLRTLLISQGKSVADATPWGLAAVHAGQIPEGSGLHPGEVLIVDAGHRNFGVMQSRPGLWRCRADSDAPATRFSTLSPEKNYPLDVTIARSGIYLLNRSETMPSKPESHGWNKDSRIFRWTPSGLQRCSLRQPLHDPSGLAADPLSTDLYAIQGALIPSASIAFQRVLRLRQVAPDEYEITPIADRFGKFAVCGIAFSADGQRMLITDTGNRVIVGLRRTGGKK